MVVPHNHNLDTVEEFNAFLNQPENEDRLFELIQRKIVEKLPTEFQAVVIGILIRSLYVYLKQNPIGWGLSKACFTPKGDRYNVRMPDASVILDRSRPLVDRGAAPYIPDLAIEVQSPDDTLREMRQKAEYYLANGAKMVCLV